MGSLIIGVILGVIAVSALMYKTNPKISFIKNTVAGVVLMLGIGSAVVGAVSYNDAGYCQHIRTITGSETRTCKTGWYLKGWGTSTAWPYVITVANTKDTEASGSSINGPYLVKLADNWTGDVTQTTRFAIPQDIDQFLVMARTFRTPERLITTTLKPAINASLDSVANMFTMEGYYSGGQRDLFKTEFSDALTKGRAVVKQTSVTSNFDEVNVNRAAASNQDIAQDTSEVGSTEVRRIITEKVYDESGVEVRIPHDFQQFGIIVSSAILEKLEPDDKYEDQVNDRKSAASRRVVAREQRLEQEEQRLLAIQRGETDIAKKQAEAKVVQIEKTTDAETEKKLALIRADRVRQEAEISKQTSVINLEKAKIDAEAVKVTADAQAYERQALLEADNALNIKLDAYIAVNKVWADAFAKRNVPSLVMGGGSDVPVGSNDEFTQLMKVLAANAAKELAVDIDVTKE